jgi:predicted tellurium resistance membrane protein TerC
MEMFLKPDTWLALLTLCFLEIVLGIDNIIFISIVSNKLPEENRRQARNVGLALAMIVRICFLLGITWIIKFKEPLFSILGTGGFFELCPCDGQGGQEFSGRDLILLFGGLFLIAKSTMEINHEMEGEAEDDEDENGEVKKKKKSHPSLRYTIIQIILLDIIFSFDSILTAVGIVPPEQVLIMIIAVVVSIIVMMFFSGQISRFIQDHPSMEVLALGFLILIGFTLFLEALHKEIPKGYIYFAVAFSLLIEFTNIRVKKKRKAKSKVVKLHKSYSESDMNDAMQKFSDKPKTNS